MSEADKNGAILAVVVLFLATILFLATKGQIIAIGIEHGLLILA